MILDLHVSNRNDHVSRNICDVALYSLDSWTISINMFASIKRFWYFISGRETAALQLQANTYWDIACNLTEQVEVYQRQLHIGETSWEMACELLHAKEEKLEDALKEMKELEVVILRLEYEKRQQQRLIDAWETESRNPTSKSEDISVDDLYDIPRNVIVIRR